MANWLVINALGGVKLMVPAAYQESARKRLEEIASNHYLKLLNQENIFETSLTEGTSCPRCQQGKGLASTVSRRLFTSLVVFILLTVVTDALFQLKEVFGFEYQALFSQMPLIFLVILAHLSQMHVIFLVIVVVLLWLFPWRYNNHICQHCFYSWYRKIPQSCSVGVYWWLVNILLISLIVAISASLLLAFFLVWFLL